MTTKRRLVLKPLASATRQLDLSPASMQPKQTDGYYSTPEWAALRLATLRRADFRCEIAGPRCTGSANIADHIVSRRMGGANELTNLRAACRACDNWLKEDQTGARRGSR